MRLMAGALAALLLASPLALAGDYFRPFGRIDDYDPASGLYYRAIDQETVRGGLLGASKSGDNRTVNINIFDPATGKSTLLFNGSQPGDITVLAYETGYKDGTILLPARKRVSSTTPALRNGRHATSC